MNNTHGNVRLLKQVCSSQLYETGALGTPKQSVRNRTPLTQPFRMLPYYKNDSKTQNIYQIIFFNMNFHYKYTRFFKITYSLQYSITLSTTGSFYRKKKFRVFLQCRYWKTLEHFCLPSNRLRLSYHLGLNCDTVDTNFNHQNASGTQLIVNVWWK